MRKVLFRVVVLTLCCICISCLLCGCLEGKSIEEQIKDEGGVISYSTSMKKEEKQQIIVFDFNKMEYRRFYTSGGYTSGSFTGNLKDGIVIEERKYKLSKSDSLDQLSTKNLGWGRTNRYVTFYRVSLDYIKEIEDKIEH